jgi:hypothetical protein
MRLASLLPCGLAALALAAEPLRGIPEDVLVAVRVSYDTAAKSKLHPAMKAMQRRMEAAAERLNPGQVQAGKDLQAKLGATEDGAHHLDLGVRITPGAGAPELAFFGAMRLEMSKAKFDAFAKEQGASPVAVGGASGWDLASLFGALQKLSGAPEQIPLEAILQTPHAVMMPADGVILVAPVAELGKTLDRWNGKAASLALPAATEAGAAATPLCHTTVHADVAKMATLDDTESDTPPGAPAEPFAGGMTRAGLHLGEDAKDLRLLVGATFGTEAQAKLAADQVRAFLPIGAMATMPADEDDEDTRFMKAEAAALLGSVKVEQQGTELRLLASHDLDRCKALLGKFEKQVLATLEAAAPGPALPPPADAPAVAPKVEADKKTDQKGR